MTKNTETYQADPREVFGTVLSKLKVPKIQPGHSVPRIQEVFASVAVRDTLIELGVKLDLAADIAASEEGCARVRFKKCMNKLGLSALHK